MDATGLKLLYNEYLYPLFTIIGIKIMIIMYRPGGGRFIYII